MTLAKPKFPSVFALALTAFVIVTVYVSFPATSHAFVPPPVYSLTCLPGLPCIEDKTDNDPTDPDDGPSVAGETNASKLNKTHTAAKPATCDADLLNQMYGRSFLEAQREKIKIQTVLRRPDTVLEYTCFNEWAQWGVAQSAYIFSESERWHPKKVEIDGRINIFSIDEVEIDVFMGPDRLENSVEKLVLDSLDMYIIRQFPYSFLGGATFLKHIPIGIFYWCPYMNMVYDIAKCNNFGDDDPFMTFKELVDVDPRVLPIPCFLGTQIIDEVIDLAENKDWEYAAIDSVDPAHTDIRDPTATCLPPIPTGLIVTVKEYDVDSAIGTVTVTDTTTTNDAVCPNPGCYLEGTACQR